jgi:uncharacterized membrane protein required for colicin V production
MKYSGNVITILLIVVIIIAMSMKTVVVMVMVMVMMRALGVNLQFLTKILIVLICEFPAKAFN